MALKDKMQRVKLADLNPAKYNPNEMDVTKRRLLKQSLEHYGYIENIVANQDLTIIDGHHRVEELIDNGVEEEDIVVLDLTKDEEKALNLALRRIKGTADPTLELEILEELSLEGFDLELAGFDELELQELTTQTGQKQEVTEDDYDPDEPVETICQKGDLYQLGKHRLLCGDSTSKEDVELLMDGQLADMVFTDPPYGVDYGAKNRFLNSFQRAGRRLEDIANDMIGKDELFDMLVDAFSNANLYGAKHCTYYVTSPQGGELGMMMMMMMMSGLPVRHVLIWNKNHQNFSLGRLDYEYKHEPIFFTWKEKHNFYGNGEFKNSVWDVDKVRKCDLHPTMKPIELITNALLNSSLENDKVLDLFGGSGSTLIACEQLDRQCYMMEIDPHYCDVIINRWEEFTSQTAKKIN